LFYVVFCVIRAVHKFDVKFVMNEAPTKRRPVKKGHAVIKTHVFDRISRKSSRVLRDSTHAVHVKSIRLSKGCLRVHIIYSGSWLKP